MRAARQRRDRRVEGVDLARRVLQEVRLEAAITRYAKGVYDASRAQRLQAADVLTALRGRAHAVEAAALVCHIVREGRAEGSKDYYEASHHSRVRRVCADSPQR